MVLRFCVTVLGSQRRKGTFVPAHVIIQNSTTRSTPSRPSHPSFHGADGVKLHSPLCGVFLFFSHNRHIDTSHQRVCLPTFCRFTALCTRVITSTKVFHECSNNQPTRIKPPDGSGNGADQAYGGRCSICERWTRVFAPARSGFAPKYSFIHTSNICGG